jgi:hypothetical protein
LASAHDLDIFKPVNFVAWQVSGEMMWFVGTGLLISVFGWAYLLLGVSAESTNSLFARPEATAHTVAIITNIINFGYALCVFGGIWEVVKRTNHKIAQRTEVDLVPQTITPARPAIEKPSPRPQPAQPPEKQRPKQAVETLDWSDAEEAFRNTFGVQARIVNGNVTLMKGRGRLDFETVEQAWQYCITHFYNSDQH